MQEECGIICDDLQKIGILMFEFVGDPQLLEVHVFMTDKYSGTISESDGKFYKLFLTNVYSNGGSRLMP